MVKLVEDGRSAEGFPHLRWEQNVPTGRSLHSAQQSIELKIAAVVMVLVFVAVYAASEQFWTAVIAALVVAGMGLAGDKMFKGGITVWDVHIKGPEPSPYAAERERQARATALTETECGEAFVLPDEETQELYFWVFRGGKPDRMKCVASVPLSSVQSLEIGTAEEWFMDVAQAEQRRLGSAPNWWVIVAPTLGHGVVPVAESGGAKAVIAALHGLLLKRFVVEAPAMQELWKAKLEEAEAGAARR